MRHPPRGKRISHRARIRLHACLQFGPSRLFPTGVPPGSQAPREEQSPVACHSLPDGSTADGTPSPTAARRRATVRIPGVFHPVVAGDHHGWAPAPSRWPHGDPTGQVCTGSPSCISSHVAPGGGGQRRFPSQAALQRPVEGGHLPGGAVDPASAPLLDHPEVQVPVRRARPPRRPARRRPAAAVRPVTSCTAGSRTTPAGAAVARPLRARRRCRTGRPRRSSRRRPRTAAGVHTGRDASASARTSP